ncbi:MAG: hypothetical protein A2X12_00615 [Bacteroidetes bacterium GWE2_29_8]|nr:MAG: hypothetical protein A2X12_00615 [Bacteroidetes bacterium GWE2_29_8]OFY20636.1 MAG: hypothetical protein A2X02_06135 [Bacteroidetes bacterium GWF2_29_10]
MKRDSIFNDVNKLIKKLNEGVKSISDKTKADDIDYDIVLDNIKLIYSNVKLLRDFKEEENELVFDMNFNFQQNDVNSIKNESKDNIKIGESNTSKINILLSGVSERLSKVENEEKKDVKEEKYFVPNKLPVEEISISEIKEGDNIKIEMEGTTELPVVEIPVPEVKEEDNIKIELEYTKKLPVEEILTTEWKEELSSKIETDEEIEEKTTIIQENIEITTEKKTHTHITTTMADLFADIEEPQKESKIINDITNAQDKISLNDKISRNKEDNSIAMKLQNNPITDIKKFIGINEKFQMVNELFKGGLDEYNNFISTINSFNNLKEAEDYLLAITESKQWNKDLDAYTFISELIRRRYL